MKYIFFVTGLAFSLRAGAQISLIVPDFCPVMAAAYSPEKLNLTFNAGYKLPHSNQAWEVWAIKPGWATVTGWSCMGTGFLSACWGVIKLADIQHESDAVSWIACGLTDYALGYLLWRAGRAHDRNHPYKKGKYHDLRYNYR